jgi:tRNA G46 methylase TrmB
MREFSVLETSENIYGNANVLIHNNLTEYETKFLKLQKPIYKIILKKATS